jgi:soluble lytic murein transglycosylase-like protein
MIHRLVTTILLVLFVSVAARGQVTRGRELSVQERALKLEPYIIDSANRYGIDPRILRVLCYLESRYRLEAVSPKGARGPMQFMPETAARYALRNPHDPKTAIDAGARYFRDLFRRFDGRVDLALAAYNAGEGTVQAFLSGSSLRLSNGKLINPTRKITGGIPPYRETQEYVRSAIDFLLNGATPPTKSRRFALGNLKHNAASASRDFSIDVTANENIATKQLNSNAKSTFIEIR